jgi:hypothetical protein
LAALSNHSCGLKALLACSGFDESTPASAKNPRMQVVMERIWAAGQSAGNNW